MSFVKVEIETSPATADWGENVSVSAVERRTSAAGHAGRIANCYVDQDLIDTAFNGLLGSHEEHTVDIPTQPRHDVSVGGFAGL